MAKLHDALDALSDRWLDDATALRPSAITGQLYHYTDAAGLAGMLQHHSVWLTDYRFLNDRSEIAHTKVISDSVIEEKISDDPDDFVQKFVDELKKSQALPNVDSPFIFSLSRDRDELSQWRGYAKEGMGFTIGFDVVALHKLQKKTGEFTLAPVEYRHERQRDCLSRAFDEFVDLLRDNDADADDLSLAGRFFDWLIYNRGAFNKHKSFESEREWRVTSYQKKTSSDIKVRVSGARLIPYTEFQMQEDGDNLPIKSIGIGPGFVEPEVSDAVAALARQHGYDVDIYAAETPFRRL